MAATQLHQEPSALRPADKEKAIILDGKFIPMDKLTRITQMLE